MTAPDRSYLPDVRAQYEALPYPARDPADESRRLLRTGLDHLPQINHHCFAGRRDFRTGFRVLVAGGGTGDATIFLAEQLRGLGATQVHLDLSTHSIAVARARARARGLEDAITWVHGSLLDLPALGLGPFDYINCSGVLHHLEDPDAGLRALRAVLAVGGALGLMVYGAIGRTGVYQMQALMRLVNAGETDMQRRIAHTRETLEALPRGNWFRRGEDLYRDHKAGDAGIYDLLLHSQDRAYTAAELHDWIEGAPEHGGHGLHLQFSEVQRGRAPYLPHLLLGHRPSAVAARLRALPRRERHAAAELLGGDITMHAFYATPGPHSVAPYGDARYVPFFHLEATTPEEYAQTFAASRGEPFLLQLPAVGVSARVRPGRYGPQLLRLIDGRRSFAEIFARFRGEWRGKAAPPDDDTLFADFADVYDTLNALERLLLRLPPQT